MLPEITELDLDIDEVQDLPEIGKSFLYDFNKGDFVLKDGKPVLVDGIEALKMWISKVIKTEKYNFKIYDGSEYGATIHDLIGSNYPRQFIESEIKREVISSLTTHPYIQDVVNWEFVRDGPKMLVRFRVITLEDYFNQEVTL